MMKRVIVSVVISISISACSQEPHFAGVYHCEGFDPYLNQYYQGTLTVTPQNTVYRIVMNYDEETMTGTAALFDTNTISVVFQNQKDPKKIGLERYSYSPDHKKIQGYWVYMGQDKLGKEVCEKIESPAKK